MRDRAATTADELLVLYREVLRLTEECWARVEGGNDGDFDAFLSRREALLDEIRRVGMSGPACAIDPDTVVHRPEIVIALRRLLDVDDRLLADLEQAKAQTAVELRALRQARGSLLSYKGDPARSPYYVDRLT